RGVLEALALRHRGALGREGDDVRGEPLRGRLERDPRARRVLEEQVDDGVAAQDGQLLDLTGAHERHLLGDVEEVNRLGAGEVGRREEVLHAPSPAAVMVTESSPSISSTRTPTRSSSALGRFLPTWSARIGSLRWPRSTRTASRTAAGR